MKATAFDYVRARDSAHAVQLLAEADGHARPIAGGQSLGPMLNLRLTRPDLLVDLGRCDDLRGVAYEDDALIYGAGLTHADIEDGVVTDATGGWLQHAARRIAYRAVRNRGTLGGSLAHADPAADWLSVMLAFGADAIVRGNDGLRAMPLEDFVVGPFATALEPHELLVAARVPRRERACRVGYRKLSVKLGEFARALAVVVDDRERGTQRAVVGAIERVPLVLEGEDAMVDGVESAERLIGARLPQLDRAWRRIHAVNLSRAVDDLRSDDGSC